jgi:hypothetical protein
MTIELIEGVDDEWLMITGFLVALVIILAWLCGFLLLVALDVATWWEALRASAWTFLTVVVAGMFGYGFWSLRKE